MKITAYSIKEKFRKLDPVLLLCTTVLSTFSLLTLWGCREATAGGVKRVFVQLAAILLGMMCTFIIANLDYESVANKLFWGFFAVSVLLLVLVLTPLGTGEGTNKSYIVIPFLPFNIQPSEFVKVTFIVTFAKHLDLVKARINHPKSLLGLGLHAGLIVGLILLEKDLGVALVYMAIIALMLFGAGLSLWYFLAVIVAAVLAFPYLWPLMEPYQQERILYGFRPELDPLDKGWQPLQSRAAIASGGVWGKGLEEASAYKTISTKGSYNDFIFGIFGEMFGFIGCAVLILTYLVLIWRIVHIARTTRKDLGGYLCFGVAAVLFAQTVENLGMCLAMLPVVGITLPFMSYGGSSMLASYMLLGIVHSVNAQRNKYYFERESG
ncbi:MAG: FtsW/RodA/SpoVE family cell cycle protein [Clostridia bacterium]|nr:FtsW/RodA/SpoVE family cell cycle protein [Clostridia bacterium]